MRFISAFLALIILAAVAAPRVEAQRRDPQGFGPLRWGMSKDQVREAFGARGAQLEFLGEQTRGATLVLTYRNRADARNTFEVLVDSETDQLIGVTSIHSKLDIPPETLRSGMVRGFGAPAEQNETPAENGLTAFLLSWSFPTTRIEVTGKVDPREPAAILEMTNRFTRLAAGTPPSGVAADPRQITHDPGSPVGGNPNGDVTIVEFFDYQCPYCKAMAPQVEALLAEDGNIRYVYKEWVTLGKVSSFAARAALAANRQGKYEAFHRALFAVRGGLSENLVLDTAEDVGLDVEQMVRDMARQDITDTLKLTDDLAKALGFEGTPAFVIGKMLVPGAVEIESLKSMVERVRLRKNGVGGLANPNDRLLIALGERVYGENCASCHGANLEGQPKDLAVPEGTQPAPPHDATGHTWHHDDEMLFLFTKRGGAAMAGAGAGARAKSNMPPFADVLTDQQIWAVLAFIKSRWPNGIRTKQARLNR